MKKLSYTEKKGELLPAKEMAIEMSEKSPLISSGVSQIINALRDCTVRGRVNQLNTNEVIVRTEEYLRACEIAGSFPSVLGLASKGLGISASSMKKFIKDHPGHPTSEYLQTVIDMIGDLLINSSLTNLANTIQVIFQLKNHYGHADNVKAEVIHTQDPLLAGASTKEEISERYKANVVVDD